MPGKYFVMMQHMYVFKLNLIALHLFYSCKHLYNFNLPFNSKQNTNRSLFALFFIHIVKSVCLKPARIVTILKQQDTIYLKSRYVSGRALERP